MATTAVFAAVLTLSGDVQQTQPVNAAPNQTSPAQEDLVNLSSGANALTAPVSAVATRLTIIPPAGNTVALTIKGVSGDTGVVIHPTDPTSIGLASTVVSVVLNAASAVNGVRVIWS